MKIYSETSLRNFEFWQGGKAFSDKLTCEELDIIESCLEDIYPDGMDETQINDLFWFDREFICDIIGESEEEIFERE